MSLTENNKHIVLYKHSVKGVKEDNFMLYSETRNVAAITHLVDVETVFCLLLIKPGFSHV